MQEGDVGDEGSWPSRAACLYLPGNCLALRELGRLCCVISDQQGLLPGATLRHRRLRVGR